MSLLAALSRCGHEKILERSIVLHSTFGERQDRSRGASQSGKTTFHLGEFISAAIKATVSKFFGLNSDALPQNKITLRPTIKIASVTTSRVTKSAMNTAQAIVLGTGLDSARDVSLTNGSQDIAAMIINKSAFSLTLSFAPPVFMEGHWSMSVLSDSGVVRCPLKFSVS